MAIITRTILGDVGGPVAYQYDYDDATLRIVNFRCINNQDHAVWGRATQVNADGTLNGSRSYGQTFQPQTTTTIPISTGASTRLQLVVNAGGKLDGVVFEGGDGPLPS